jgi:hypothetical protein
MEIMPEDRREKKSEISASVVTYSDDPDANWVKKGKTDIRLTQKKGSSWEDTLPLPILQIPQRGQGRNQKNNLCGKSRFRSLLRAGYPAAVRIHSAF